MSFYDTFPEGLKCLPNTLNCTCCKDGTYALVPAPSAEHAQLAGPDADSARPRAPPGRVRSRSGPLSQAPKPGSRQALAPRSPSHSQRLHTRKHPNPRRPSGRECYYLTPLLRKPRNVRPAAPGTPTSCAALPPSAGTWPRRPQSSEKLRTGTAMAAAPSSKLRVHLRLLGSSQPQPGLRPTQPGGITSPTGSGSGASCRGGARSQAHGR